MSAQHAPHDDDAGRDPHDIIPDEFWSAWPGDTVAEKLRAAEMREVMSKIDAELSPAVAATSAFRAASDGGVGDE